MDAPHFRRLASELLNSRLNFHEIHKEHFKGGFESREEVVPSCRFIVVTKGTLIYQAEEDVQSHDTGTILFVPPWVWRKWSVPGNKSVDLLWTVFTAKQRIFSTKRSVFSSKPADIDLIRESMERVYRLRNAQPFNDLLIESEVKTALTRFFYSIFETSASVPATSKYHPDVDHAINWLHAHYMEPSALTLLQAETSLHPDYFRDLFRRQTHQNPNQYLNTLRMRSARFFLRETARPIKQIAGELGFSDPLYFSRAYRKFWSRSPSEERKN